MRDEIHIYERLLVYEEEHMATFYQTDHDTNFGFHRFSHMVETQVHTALHKFQRILNSYALFHLSFLTLLALQLITTLILLITNPISPIFAISLASVFLTFFSYLIINYYFQEKKPDQFVEIKKEFFESCKKIISFDLEDHDYHLSLANSAFQLSTYITQKHIYAFSIPPFQFLETAFLKLSYYLHYKDLQMMQELLMRESIQEHIELIKKTPTDLTVHTSLANAYISTAKIYSIPSSLPFVETPFFKRLYSKPALQEKFHLATQRAIEELKILDDLAPNDPWIHAQLATCFHQLQMFDEEIKEYEILLSLRSKDKEILFRLGLLYFQLGKTSKGLQIYEKLQQIDALDAKHLISHYTRLT